MSCLVNLIKIVLSSLWLDNCSLCFYFFIIKFVVTIFSSVFIGFPPKPMLLLRFVVEVQVDLDAIISFSALMTLVLQPISI